MNYTTITACSKCFEYNDICKHRSPLREFQCGICLEISDTRVQAERCCSNLVDNTPLPESCLAPKKKFTWVPKPDNDSQYGRKR